MTKALLSVLLVPTALSLASAAPPPADPAPQATTRFVVAATGNEARFKVREILMGAQLPNDAVGATNKVTGQIVVGANGQPIAAQSRIVVDASDLRTDVTMRDNFIKRNTLQTEQHPNVEFVPTSIQGLGGALPTSGSRTFQIVGNLKIRDETRTVTWNARAEFAPGRVTGSAATRFNFQDFDMEPPRAGRVFQVSPAINLEYDFNLVAQ